MARPRQSKQTRGRLVDEAIEQFLQHGYHGTGLQQILDRVQVPKGSFYNYFASKEELAAATVRRYAECLGEKMQDALAASPNPLSGLRRFFERLRSEFEAADYTGGCLVANLGGELEGSQICREALAEALQGWRGGVRDALAEAQDAGLVRTDIPAGDLADLLIDTWEGAVIRMKIERSLEPLDRSLTRLLDEYFSP